MKTLHVYLTRQILASLLMTVMVFTFVLFLGNALKEIVSLLVTGRVSVGVVATAAGLLVPFVWVFALPMGMLTATLLVFGRFSADQEYTAVRASGISLVSLVTPILLLSVALCGVSALVNMELGPRCRVKYTTLIDQLRMEFARTQLPEGQFIPLGSLDGAGAPLIVYVGRNDRKGNLRDVMVLMPFNATNLQRTVLAPRGKMEVDPVTQRLNLTLYNAKIIEASGDAGSISEGTISLDTQPSRRAQGVRVSDMTFTQLCTELREMERRVSLPISVRGLSPEQVAARRDQWEKARKKVLAPVVFQIHRQVSFSFACFSFTLLGIPLGLRVHRRETNVGIAVALVLVALYYSFIVLGQSLQSRPEFAPNLIVWLPNLLFQAVGAFLLWRANRGV